MKGTSVLRYAVPVLALAGLLVLPGCINMRSERGVAASWNEPGQDAFAPGRTSRTEVLDRLGPPSQIITLEGGSAFYYLLERTRAKGLILLVYNTRSEETTYERAVFFFDADGLLVEYAMR